MKRFKPKTVRRLVLLTAVALIGVVALVGFVWVRSWQIARRYERARADGLSAFARAEYDVALDNLARYLRRSQDDATALVAYAGSREHILERDGRHLIEAMRFYERAMVLEPQNSEAAFALLRLYRLLGRLPEARDLAAQLRPSRIEVAQSSHSEALEAEFGALAGLKDRGDRLERILARLLELRVFAKEAFITHALSLVRDGRASEAGSFARQVATAFPDDPWSSLLTLLVETGDTHRAPAMLSGLCRLIGIDERSAEPATDVRLPDARFAIRTSSFFDSLARPDHSFAVLRLGADLFDDAELRMSFLRRCWQRGMPDEVLARTSEDGWAEWDFRSELLAFRALALLDRSRHDEARAVINRLESLRGDYRAEAWAEALRVLLAPAALGTTDALAKLRAAARDHPQEPIIEFLCGESLTRLGRSDEAREAWLNAARSPLSIGWPAPAVRAAQTFLAEGRIAEATDASLAAITVAPTSTIAVVSWIETETVAARLGFRTLQQARELEARVDRLAESIRENDPTGARELLERLLLCQIGLRARLSQLADAATLGRRALAAETPPSSQFMVNLARLSAESALGVSQECLVRHDAIYGPSPDMSAAAALERGLAGEKDGALRELERAVGAAPADEQEAWELCRVRVLESLEDPQAAQAWRTLIGRYKESPQVLEAFLRAPSSARHLDIVEESANRLAMLTGTTGASPPAFVRLARARALLAADPTRRRHEEAVSLLHALSAQAPGLLEARELLVQALLRRDPVAGIAPDVPGALTQIRALATTAPEPWRFRLHAARLLQQRREFDRARDELTIVLSEGGSPMTARADAAILLMSQADYGPAAAALETIIAADAVSTDPRLLLPLGRCYLSLGRKDEAAAVYLRLSEHDLLDPDQILESATGLLRTGHEDIAERLIGRLDTLDIPSALKEIARGEFSERRNDLQAAEAAYTTATQLDPHSTEAWSRLVTLLIDEGRLDDARHQLGLALAALPGDAGLRMLQQRAEIAGRLDSEIDLRALAEALALDPGRVRDAEAVRAIEVLTSRGKLQDPVELARLASMFEDVLPVQGFVARHLLALPRPDPDRAMLIAARTLQQFPASADAARLAVEVAATAGRWSEMLDAARTWRVRDPDAPAAADLAVADALHRLGRHQQAVDSVRARIGDAAADPSGPYHLAMLDVYARSLVMLGRPHEALALLMPLLDSSSELRQLIWIPIAVTVIESPEQASEWMRRVRPKIPPESLEEIASLAQGYLALADRFGTEGTRFIESASEVLEQFNRSAEGTTTELLEALGALRERQDRREEAMAAFRRALESDSRSLTAATRLAVLLLASGSSADAIQVAEACVAARGEADVDALMLLARTCQDAAEGLASSEELRKRALECCRRAADLSPGLVEAHLRGAALAGDLQDFRASLEMYLSALALPLAPRELEANVLNNAAFTTYKARGTSEQLLRAREWARRAVDMFPTAPYLDTLAHVEGALGNRREAVEVFRRAVASDSKLVSAILGLADSLIRGTPSERSEALSLVKDLDRQIADGTIQIRADAKLELEQIKLKLGVP